MDKENKNEEIVSLVRARTEVQKSIQVHKNREAFRGSIHSLTDGLKATMNEEEKQRTFAGLDIITAGEQKIADFKLATYNEMLQTIDEEISKYQKI